MIATSTCVLAFSGVVKMGLCAIPRPCALAAIRVASNAALRSGIPPSEPLHVNGPLPLIRGPVMHPPSPWSTMTLQCRKPLSLRRPPLVLLALVGLNELSAVDGQFETELATLAFKDLKVDASGLVFARRDQLSEVEGISSKSPLALAIPGHSLKSLPESIVSIPNRITCTLVVMDPSLQRKELKNAMLIPLGAVPIKLKAHSQEDFTPGPTAEVAVLACRSNYEADGVDWPGFVSNVCTQLRDAILQQITSEHRARTEFYAWRKLSDDIHRVIVRVPSPAFEPLLAASGVSGPFTVQPVWRTADRKEELDKKFTIEWLGRLSLAESRVVLRKLPKHFGLQQNKSGFGIRVALDAVSLVRTLAKPTDARYNEHNRGVAGRLRWSAYGFPDGTSSAEVSAVLRTRLKWDVIVNQPVRRGANLIFPLSSDTSPSDDVFELRTGPILLRKAPPGDRRPSSRPPRSQRVPSAATPVTARRANPSVSPQAELAARVSNLEKRLGEQEVRTRSLESKLDAGFDKVLCQLATLRAPAAPAPGP